MTGAVRFARRRVARVDAAASRPGLQALELDDDSAAYALTDLVGTAAVGDELLVNTTAVELGLGTGGRHVVHVNLTRPWLGGTPDGAPAAHGPAANRPAVVVKARYLSEQLAVECAPAAAPAGPGTPLAGTPQAGTPQAGTPQAGTPLAGTPPAGTPLAGMGFVLCILHSHAMALAAAAPAADRPAVAYLMTDEAALPYALSDLAAQLADRGLLAATVSAGQAFGAEIESVNVASGALALRDRGLTRVVVSPGPGHAGTETALGFATLAQAGHAALLSALGADVALAVRASERDSRARHRGVSHHTRTLVALTPEAVAVPVPTASALPARGPGESPAEWPASARARLRPFDPVDVAGALTHHRLPIATMGVPLADDSLACAFLGAAAAWLAQPPQ